jgi:serine/threonine-protein kinase RsbW
MQPDRGTQRIEVNIPGRPEFVAVARLAAAGVAGRMAFSFDDVEDIKIAVGEACTAAILAGAPDVRVRFDVADDRLEVRVAHPAGAPPSEPEGAFGLLLIRCLMDEVRMVTDRRSRQIRMTKVLKR